MTLREIASRLEKIEESWPTTFLHHYPSEVASDKRVAVTRLRLDIEKYILKTEGRL